MARGGNEHWARLVLSIPCSFAVALLVSAGTATWFPQGLAELDHIVVPLALMPATLAGVFLYVWMEPRVMRAALILGAIAMFELVVIALHLSGIAES